MIKRLLLYVLLVSMAGTVVAQSFRVSVNSPSRLGRDFELWLYDSDTLSQVIKTKSKKGPLVFVGKINGTSYAELRHNNMVRPLPFFIENADITINYNADDPEASPITGSRANSVLRYQLEQCGVSDVECLSRFVAENPSAAVSPYILDRYIAAQSDYETIQRLYGMLSGEAQKAYHFKRLGSRLKIQSSLSVGKPLPLIEFADQDNRRLNTDTLFVEGKWNILLIGASYCRQCDNIKKEVKENFPDVNMVTLNVDSLSSGWDSPFMKQLDIDHIPYLMILDKEKKIEARDVRFWEIKRIIHKQ